MISIVFAFVLLAGLLLIGLVWFTSSTAKKVEAALPPRGVFIDIDGESIHYLDIGSGPPLVMIHGLGGSLLNYAYALSGKLAGDFRVILVDRPGSGYSIRASRSTASVKAQAQTIARLIVSLGLQRPLIVGHSLGGAVSLAIALYHPEQVSALALIAPLTHEQQSAPGPFKALAIRSRLIRRLVAWTIATPISIRRRKVVLETLFGPDPVPEDFATKGGGLLGLRPRSFFAASSDLVAVHDDLPALAPLYVSLKLPIGILFGIGDRILSYVAHGEAMRKMPNVDLTLVNGGHMLPVSSSDEVASLIRSVAIRSGRSTVKENSKAQ